MYLQKINMNEKDISKKKAANSRRLNLRVKIETDEKILFEFIFS